MRTHLISTSIIAVILAITFLTFPEIDLWVTGLAFFEEGNHFYLSNDPILTFLHKSVRWITISCVVMMLIAAIYHKVRNTPLLGLTYRKLIFLVLVLAVGPGLLTNTLLKENWGRARPHHVVEFGGTKEFSPPILIADQCESNCSFVSGDAAVGFFFFALLFVFDRKYRRFLFPLAITTSTVFSSMRVLQGAHFLSDVLFAGIVTYFTIILMSIWVLQKHKS